MSFTLPVITTGYNTSLVNNNFQSIVLQFNTNVVYSQGGQNVMYQDFDLNSHNLLNVGTLYATSLYFNGVLTAPSTLTQLATNSVGTANIIDGAVTASKLDPSVLASYVPYSNLASTASGQGSNLIGYQFSGTGSFARTVQTRLQDFVSVKDFGAKGDGITDDTAAIQAALTAMNAIGGGMVMAPAGTYLCGPLTGYNNVSFVGQSKWRTVIVPKTTGQTCFSNVNATLTAANIEYRDFSINCGAVASVQGFQFTLCAQTTIENVAFAGCLKNFDIDRGYLHAVKNCLSLGTASLKAGNFRLWSSSDTDYIYNATVSGYQVRNIGNGVQGPAAYVRRGIGCLFDVSINDASLGGAVTAVAFENDCQGCKLYNGIVSACDIGVSFSTGTGVAVAPAFCTVDNFDIDQSVTAAIQVNSGAWLTFSNGDITSSGVGVTNQAINLKSCNNISIFGNTFHGYSGTAGGPVILDSTCHDIEFTDNNVDNCYMMVWFNGAVGDGMRFYDNTLTNVTVPFYGSTPITGVRNLLTRNSGTTYGGATPAFPASGTAVTNTQGFPMRIYLTGGTVTGIIIGGITFNAALPAVLTLNPDETIAINYTGTPSWQWSALN